MMYDKRTRTTKALKFAIIVIFMLSLIEIDAVLAERRCKYNEFVIVDIFGKKSCFKCPNCSIGYGLSPDCGSCTINYGDRFQCQPCKPGISYSTSNDISSCKPCGICADHMKQISKCTPTNNSKCGNNCDHGFYYSSVTFDCQECSWCCKQSPSSPIKDCQGHGIPFYKQCSADDALFCQPKCTNKQFVFVDKSLNRTCIDCPKCPLGKGLSPKCSSVITPDNKTKCVTCIPGITFSDVKDSSTCERCTKCEVGKKIERLCNTTHDTMCGDCEHGFYNDAKEKNTIRCRECSYCCGDNHDVRVQECVAQELPTDKQCAYTARAVTKCHPVQQKSKNLVIILVSVIPGSIVILIIILVWYCCYYKPRHKYSHIPDRKEFEVSRTHSSNPLENASGTRFEIEKPSYKSTASCILYLKSEVKIVCDNEDVGQDILDKVSVEVCPDFNCLPMIGEREMFLSPVIKLHPQDLCLEYPVKLHLFHSAHVEDGEIKNWSMTVLKSNSLDDSSSEWTNLGNLKNIDIEKGWVEISENELGSYVVVGTPGGDRKLSKKRMCCAVFGEADPRVNKPYAIKMFFIDECEPSFQKLECEERKEDHQLLSRLRVFHPDVDPESSISLHIESLSEGFTMTNNCPSKIYSQEWLHSYKKVPQFEATFVHQEATFRGDFSCNFVVKLNDAAVMTIPVTSTFLVAHGSEACPTGVQVENSSSCDFQGFGTDIRLFDWFSKDKNFRVQEKICIKLDTDYSFTKVARYFKLADEDEIKRMKQMPGSNPADDVLEKLRTSKPGLLVSEFVTCTNSINRNDVSELLQRALVDNIGTTTQA